MRLSEKLNVTLLLYAYAILLGALYLFAFWRPFGFNIFPYLSLQDYISAPINGVVIILLFPLFIYPLLLFLEFNIKTLKIYLVGVLCSYNALALYFLVGNVQLFLTKSFHYRNEINALVLVFVLMVSTWGVAINARRFSRALQGLVLAIVIAQICTVLAAGYNHGKTIFNGALEVHFLDNNEVCEKEGNTPWIFLGRFSNSSIFMNAIDKRLCFTDAKNYRLVSRMIVEHKEAK